jgi:hypothetical protein
MAEVTPRSGVYLSPIAQAIHDRPADFLGTYLLGGLFSTLYVQVYQSCWFISELS